MPKESGPQGMNRRSFLKTVATSVGAIVSETRAQAQEKKVVDNRVEELVFETDNIKINYPEKAKKITPEIEAIILSIVNYQLIYLGKNLLDKSLPQGGEQEITNIGSNSDVLKAKKNVWDHLKKFDSSLPEYSDEIFYKVLAHNVPKYLSDYGIYAKPTFLSIVSNDEKGLSATFELNELRLGFLNIDHIEHDEVEQQGIKVARDVLYVKGSVVINGQTVFDENYGAPAENGFQNIMFFENGFEQLINQRLGAFRQYEQTLFKHPQAQLITEQNLEKSNQSLHAAELAMIKIVKKMKGETGLSMENFKEGALAHETCHRVDHIRGDFDKIWYYKKTADPVEYKQRHDNRRIHEEINPIITEFKYAGPVKHFRLLELISNTKDPNTLFTVKKSAEWIIMNIIKVIEQDPENYGVKISKGSNINVENQILSQLDVLVDKPDLLNFLADKLIVLHNKNLAEDIVGKIYSHEKNESDSQYLYKIGIPTAVVGGAALALEALRRRKNKMALEANMSRQNRRQQERKKRNNK